jgi:rhodanese-related sulfurtransferase
MSLPHPGLPALRSMVETPSMLSKLKQLLQAQPAAPRTVRWIECADLAARLTCETLVIIDVRGPDEFDGPLGHIEGAVNVPVDTILAGKAGLAELGPHDIVLVCRTDKRSARAAAYLESSGRTGVLVLRGGMESWNAVGMPVVRRQAAKK